ncbi:hypothetical protein HK405_007077 [Cladochytrium tenue]|nr:hypothetical protein HK405_007077 [Cladochytrium tenue]
MLHIKALMAKAALVAAYALTAAGAAAAAPHPLAGPAPADRTVNLVRRFDWQSDSTGAIMSASDCDWTGGDVANETTTSDGCGSACAAYSSGCDHFTWTSYNGGTCWLKSASAGVDTTAVYLSGAVCGWVNGASSGSATATASNVSGSSTSVTSAASSATSSSSSTSGKVTYAGVNEAGLEFGMTISGPTSGTVPGTLGSTYYAPDATAVQHTVTRFANVFRLPFMWERLQTSLYADFDSGYLATLQSAVSTITATGASVILDPHNYARYNGNVVSGADLADLWTRLATLYGNNSQVIFGLMNEPHGIDTATWFSVAQQSANAIRSAGASNLILVPGNCYTGAHSWVSGSCDTGSANGVAGLSFSDTNYAYEMHQYFDSDFSGTSTTCTQDGAGVLGDATSWLRSNGKKGFLGEFGVADNSACLTALEAALSHLDSNNDVWLGYTYWAAGSGWGSYMYSVESTSDSTDNDMFNILANHPGTA